jgi:hypothetical protein
MDQGSERLIPRSLLDARHENVIRNAAAIIGRWE